MFGKKKTGLLAIDQGTTSTRSTVFSLQGDIVATASQELPQIYPKPGWVEHDPEQIWAGALSTARAALKEAEGKGVRVEAVGLANQRETAIVWERDSGRPIHNAIVWQDRRTAGATRALGEAGHGDQVAEITGLVLDPYFSATKLAWILDHVDGARARAARGELAFGTVDSFLLWRLTGGRTFATDVTNAARTSLFALETAQWDEEMLALFDVPAAILPEARACDAAFGETDKAALGWALPIRGVAGDQQAALVGQAGFEPGAVKITYGTGAFLVLNTGAERVRSTNRLLATIGYRIGTQTAFAAEGSILAAGATVQWVRDGLGLIARAGEIEALAAAARPDAQVYLVPAFAGLGAPHWDPDARAAIIGLTRDAGRAEIAQAALDAAAYQTWELLDALAGDGAPAKSLRVDGGMAANDRFLQRLSDICDIEVVRPANIETTAWGAALLAGLGAGIFGSLEESASAWRAERIFTPQMDPATRERLRAGWREAVARVKSEAAN